MNPIYPDSARFSDRYEAGKPVLVWTEMVADLETPVAAYLKLADGEDFSFLLESVEDGDIGGRYSIIGLQPDLLFRVENGQPQVIAAQPWRLMILTLWTPHRLTRFA